MTLAKSMNEATKILLFTQYFGLSHEHGHIQMTLAKSMNEATKILSFTQYFGLSHEHGHILLNFQNTRKTYIGFQVGFQLTIIIFHLGEISGYLFIIKCFAQVNLFKQQQLP